MGRVNMNFKVGDVYISRNMNGAYSIDQIIENKGNDYKCKIIDSNIKEDIGDIYYIDLNSLKYWFKKGNIKDASYIKSPLYKVLNEK